MSPQEIQDLWKSRKMQIADKLCQQGGLDGKQVKFDISLIFIKKLIV
jgi:hypothetical protein